MALARWVQKPEILEAIFLASPDLMEAIPAWIKSPESNKGVRCERALVKYFSRMCGRSTPFGLFAGCSVGVVGSSTSMRIEGKEHYRRHSRLDMGYLCSLAEALSGQKDLREALIYHPNSSLHKSGDRMHFAKAKMNRKTRSYQLVAVESTPYLLSTLRRAEGGASLRELAGGLVDEDISIGEALDYMHDLVESQILVSDLQPNVTGDEPVLSMVDRLKNAPGGNTASSALKAAAGCLAEMDSGGLGQAVEQYLRVAENLRALPCEVELNRLFQVDLFKPVASASLGPEVIQEAEKAVDLLYRLPLHRSSEALTQFKEAFLARFDGQEVPLAEALDEDSGIGFAPLSATSAETSPLLEGIAFPGLSGQASSPWDSFHTFLLEKLHACEEGGVLRIAAEEIRAFEPKAPLPLPRSFSLVGRLAAKSESELAAGAFKLSISSVSGPSGAKLLGRFCHGDKVLSDQVSGLVALEESGDQGPVLAEIVHLPEGRIGNVILRPKFRRYEIPFLGRSGAPEEEQIQVSDLLISVRGGRIVLRSRRLEREVIPRLTSAHNYSAKSLGVYRFLCLLQHQDAVGGLAWTWGPLDSLSYLPRVEVGRLVLTKARWVVERSEVASLLHLGLDDRKSVVQAWQVKRRLPRLCLLVDGDNKLPLDMENPFCVDSLIDLVKNRERFVLEEMFPGPEDLIAEGPEGKFVHELVIPFINREVEVPAAPKALQAQPIIQRSFLPGSEWLYAKIYAGAGSIDRLIHADLGPMIAELRLRGVMDSWYFIRYSDPDWHLRLRIHGDPATLAQSVLPVLASVCEGLVSKGVIRKMVLDTYDRELERYGGDSGMEISERVFEVDSEAVLDLLRLYEGDGGMDARWRLCLRGMDDLLSMFQFDMQAKHQVLTGLRAGFIREFRGEDSLTHQLGIKYRKEKTRLEGMLDGNLEDPDLLAGLRVLKNRRQSLAPLGKLLLDEAGGGVLNVEDLAGSYLHMHANRMLRSAQRAQELVLYDFLARHYESLLARSRSGSTV